MNNTTQCVPLVGRNISPVPYPGGKTRLAKLITRTLAAQGDYRNVEYREPFVGGGSIAHALLPELNKVWINDIDVDLAALHTSVMNYQIDLMARIWNFEPSLDSFNQIRRDLCAEMHPPHTRDEIVYRGFSKLAVHRMSYSGLRTMGGPRPDIGSQWNGRKLSQTIGSLHEMFGQVKVRENRCTTTDFEELILDDSSPALIYLDPPHVNAGIKCYKHAFDERDHVRLADALKQTQHGWVMTYDDHPLIRTLYKDWAHLHEINVRYSLAGARVGGELLITPRK